MKVRRNVIFKSSAFNTSERKPYFINDCCYGDDLARSVISALRANGVRADDEPGQEDFGWYLGFRIEETPYTLVITYRPGETAPEGDWICTVERVPGCLGFLVGAQNRGIRPEAPAAIHKVLAASSQITDVRWFDDDEMRTEENGHPAPEGP
jgi:hypothetical protein